MPEGLFLPPWLTRDYSPVETFMRAYQTGAQISEAQARLAEQQRQANMEAQARQEQLQANMLRAMTETAVQKEYQQQQIALRQQDLAQEKARYDALGEQAANDLAEQIRHNQEMEAFRQAEVQRNVTPELMNIGGRDVVINPKTGHFQMLFDPNRQFQQSLARAEAADILKRKHTLEAKQKEEGVEETKRKDFQKQIDALSAEYGAKLAPWTNAPLSNLAPPRPPGPPAIESIETAPARSERIAGKRYRTPKGIYTWTGDGWTE